jgi:hypothetical protein
MTMRAAKIAVSLPADTFRKLEKRRRETKKTRSAIVAEALDAWLDGRGFSDEERRYIAGYLAQPENDGDAMAISMASAWSEWDET